MIALIREWRRRCSPNPCQDWEPDLDAAEAVRDAFLQPLPRRHTPGEDRLFRRITRPL
jgi:hypothetical protein